MPAQSEEVWRPPAVSAVPAMPCVLQAQGGNITCTASKDGCSVHPQAGSSPDAGRGSTVKSAGAGKHSCRRAPGSLALRLCIGCTGAVNFFLGQDCGQGCAQGKDASGGLHAQSQVSPLLKPSPRLTGPQDSALPRLQQMHNMFTVSRAQLLPLPDPPPQLIHTPVFGAPDRQHLWVPGVTQVLQVQAGL